MAKAALFWSGGKDSAIALHQVLKNPDLEVIALVCTINKDLRKISMHGIREDVLERQCEALQIPLVKMYMPDQPSNGIYEDIFHKTCLQIRGLGADTVIFGDIFLEDLRKYREQLVFKSGLKALFPLWGIPTKQLVAEVISDGFEAIICCINHNLLEKNYLGRMLDPDFINELPTGIDPCGEYGEYHTFCFNGPIFRYPVNFKIAGTENQILAIKGESTVSQTNFLYIDII